YGHSRFLLEFRVYFNRSRGQGQVVKIQQIPPRILRLVNFNQGFAADQTESVVNYGLNTDTHPKFWCIENSRISFLRRNQRTEVDFRIAYTTHEGAGRAGTINLFL